MTAAEAGSQSGLARSYYVGSADSERQNENRRLRGNRGQVCCCLLRLAKRIGSGSWRAVFGSGGGGGGSCSGGRDVKDGATSLADSRTASAGSPAAVAVVGGGVAGTGGSTQPPPPRGPSGLVGLENQGATCYLNSLVQVLAFSPELRRAIFAVSPEQLGLDEHGFPAEGDRSLRRIPYELQRLLARILMADSAYVSTRELTESFGWRGREHGDQHDVQELSRLLLHAMEESLVDTQAYQPIKAAVAGSFISGVECLACGFVSSQSEEFLDICLTTVGFSSVENSLQVGYGVEKLEGSNQYRCDKCCKMVDPKKFCRLERLPPILTLSLMRFNYDRDRMQRVKNDAKFTFPSVLDMRPHMSTAALTAADAAGTGSNQFQYELYAVIAHGGSAMGGHYRAFVLDLERRGFPAGSPPLKKPASQSNLSELLRQPSANGDLLTQGGAKHPPQLHQRSHSSGSNVGSKIKQSQSSHSQQQRQWFMFSDTQVRQVPDSAIKEQFAGHECAYMLFYRRLPPAQSAASKPTASGDAVQSEIPGWLYKSILAENASINQRREECEIAANTACFEVFSEAAFRLGDDRLIWTRQRAAETTADCQQMQQEVPPQDTLPPPLGSVCIDCRLPVVELLRRIDRVASGQMGNIGSVLCLEQTPSGFYCLAKLSELPNNLVSVKSTLQLSAQTNTVVILCLRGQVEKSLRLGEEHRPILLSIRVFNQATLELGLSRSTALLACLRQALEPHFNAAFSLAGDSTTDSKKRFKAELDRTTVYLRRAGVYPSYPLSKSDEIPRDRFKRSLQELELRDGDTLIVRSNSPADSGAAVSGSNGAGAASAGSADGDNGTGGSGVAKGIIVDVIVCLSEKETESKTFTIELNYESTIGDLKMCAVNQLCRDAGGGPPAKDDYNEYCLLIYNDMLNCYCPEYENTPYKMIRYNARPVKLERSSAFADNQIFVRVHLPSNHSVTGYVVHRDMPVSDLRQLAATDLAGGPDFAQRLHLCFYSPPAGRALDEIKEGASLAHSRVRHRSCLCLKPGRAIQTGQLRIEIYELLPFDSDWLAVLTNQPSRLFAHRLTLDISESSSLSTIRESLSDTNSKAQVRLYSFKADEARLVAVLHPFLTNLRKLAEPGWAVCYERPQAWSSPPPQQLGSRVLLYLTVKSQQDGQYPPPSEFWWDLTTADGDGGASLYHQVAQKLDWPVGELRLAKRLHHGCIWRPLAQSTISLRRSTGEGVGSVVGGGDVLREFEVIGCMRVTPGGLDRFESHEDERLLSERGGGVGGVNVGGTPGAAAVAAWSGPQERCLIINVPKYSSAATAAVNTACADEALPAA